MGRLFARDSDCEVLGDGLPREQLLHEHIGRGVHYARHAHVAPVPEVVPHEPKVLGLRRHLGLGLESPPEGADGRAGVEPLQARYPLDQLGQLLHQHKVGPQLVLHVGVTYFYGNRPCGGGRQGFGSLAAGAGEQTAAEQEGATEPRAVHLADGTACKRFTLEFFEGRLDRRADGSLHCAASKLKVVSRRVRGQVRQSRAEFHREQIRPGRRPLPPFVICGARTLEAADQCREEVLLAELTRVDSERRCRQCWQVRHNRVHSPPSKVQAPRGRRCKGQ